MSSIDLLCGEPTRNASVLPEVSGQDAYPPVSHLQAGKSVRDVKQVLAHTYSAAFYSDSTGSLCDPFADNFVLLYLYGSSSTDTSNMTLASESQDLLANTMSERQYQGNKPHYSGAQTTLKLDTKRIRSLLNYGKSVPHLVTLRKDASVLSRRRSTRKWREQFSQLFGKLTGLFRFHIRKNRKVKGHRRLVELSRQEHKEHETRMLF